MCIMRRNWVKSYTCLCPSFIGYTIRITHIHAQAHTSTRLHIRIYKFTCLDFWTRLPSIINNGLIKTMLQNVLVNMARVVVLDDYNPTLHHVSILAKIRVTSDLCLGVIVLCNMHDGVHSNLRIILYHAVESKILTQ